MKTIVADENLVAKCGLYCGACKRYLTDKCPGCSENERATWCGIRTCTLEHGYTTCVDCGSESIESCKDYNNFMAKLFGFIFRSNRRAGIERIRVIGPVSFAKEMTERGKMTLKR